jgi:hypothetical protein
MDTHYLIGVVPRGLGADMPFAGNMIIYTPPNSELAKGPLIGFYEPSPRGSGGSTDAATWLARNCESWRQGWIERQCAAANCAWLMPMLHRLAAQEEISLAEFESAYAAHNQDQIMARGTFYELIELVNRGTAK